MEEKLKLEWEKAIFFLLTIINRTKALGMENTQEALDYIDKVNKLSVEF